MKRLVLLKLLCLCFVLLGNMGFAYTQNGTIHALFLIDEHSDIASACIADKFKMEEEVQIISQKTRLDLNLVPLDYSKEGVLAKIDQLTVGENDVIFFYFTGHGYRYENQQSCGNYPFLYLTKTKEHLYDAGLCLEQITSKLKAKGARLTIALADCCNNVLPYEEPVAMNTAIMGEVYKQLFLLSGGFLVATSSLPGQYSFATNNGGYFTNSFLETVRSIATKDNALELATWDNVMKSTRVKTILSSDSKQKPQYAGKIQQMEEKAIPGQVILPKN